jgi:hypothetical protein
MRFSTYALLASMTLGGVAFAQDAKPAASQPAASQPAAAPGKPVEVTDLDTIKASVGKELTVHGKVSGTFKPQSGSVIIINFEGVNRTFVAVIDKSDFDAVNAAFGGDVAEAVKGKTLTITGPIKLYREKPQIVISKPEQVKVETDAPPAEGEKKETEKKE